MAQGQWLSVLARLQAGLTDDEKDDPQLRLWAQRLMQPLAHHLRDEGVGQWLCLSRDRCYAWYAEYPVRPPVYTLNGFIFVLIGLYDWAAATFDEEATRLFRAGLATLHNALPLWDNTPLSTYDLAHLSWVGGRLQPKQARIYHGVHIHQLQWLSKATCDPRWACVARVWRTYLDKSPSARRSLRKECGKHFPSLAWERPVPFDKTLSTPPASTRARSSGRRGRRPPPGWTAPRRGQR